MALMKDVSFPPGTNLADYFPEGGFTTITKNDFYTANNVYIVITRINGTKDELELIVEFKKDRSSETILTKRYIFTPDLDSQGNLFKQGYNYLKSLDEYKGAIDVPDQEDGDNTV